MTDTITPSVQLTLATFDSEWTPDGPQLRFNLRRRDKRLDTFPAIGHQDYKPDGGTPLRDATMSMIHVLDKERSAGTITLGILLDESGSMGRNREAVIVGVNEFVAGLRDVPASDGGRVLCVIFTDGLENTSRKMSPDELRAAVGERENDGWTFIYMGANQDAWDEGSTNLGISGGVSGQSVNYTSSPVGTQSAWKEAGRRSTAYVTGPSEYAAAAADVGNNSTIAEDGTITPAEDAAPKDAKKPKPKPAPKPKPYGDVSDALDQAKKSTGS